MVHGTRWYGLVSKSPKEYFDSHCHTYSDISQVLERKGPNILSDIKPCMESFISTNKKHELMPDSMVEELIRIGSPPSVEIAEEAIKYDINHLEYASESNNLWYIWSNIPEIERLYRLGKVTESTFDTLNKALYKFADMAASTLTTFETKEVDEVVKEFVQTANINTMVQWNDYRNTIAKAHPKVAYIGDIVNNATPEDIAVMAKDNDAISDDVVCCQNIAKLIIRQNANSGFPSITEEGYYNLVTEIYGILKDIDTAQFAATVESLYARFSDALTPEALIMIINYLLRDGLLTNLVNEECKKQLDELCRYFNKENCNVSEGAVSQIGDHEYNMDSWKQGVGSNVLYVTGAFETPALTKLTRRFPDAKVLSVREALLDPDIVDEDDDREDQIADAFNYLQQIAGENANELFIMNGGPDLLELFNEEEFHCVPMVVRGFKNDNPSPLSPTVTESSNNTSVRCVFDYYNKQRQSLIAAMESDITSEMLTCDISTLLRDGEGYVSEAAERFLDSTSMDYVMMIATEKSKDDDEKLKKKQQKEEEREEKRKERAANRRDRKEKFDKTARKVKDTAYKGSTKVSMAYSKYKKNEEAVDGKLNKMIEFFRHNVMHDSDAARRELVEGKRYSPIELLKTILGGYAIFCVSKVALVIVIISRYYSRKKVKASEKQKVLMELNDELVMLDEKIRDAEADGNREAKYALMRNRQNMQNAIDRIKRGYEGDSSRRGTGAKEIITGRVK